MHCSMCLNFVTLLQRSGHGKSLLPTCTQLAQTAVHVPYAGHVCTAGDSEHELSGFTPSFLWLLRDFYLSLEEEGRKVFLLSHHCNIHDV